MSVETVPQLFLHAVETYDRRDAFCHLVEGRWVDISHRDVLERVHHVALALQALNLARGDRVAILSENRIEWAIADLAIQSAGLVTVPVYATLPGDQAAYILADCEARAVFVADAGHLETVRVFRADLPMLLHVFSFDDTGEAGVVPFEALVERGRMVESKPAYRDLIATVGPKDWASIIYTSGTTGRPKGVVLSHKNFTSNVQQCLAVFSLGPSDTCLSFLPLSHAFERTAGFYSMMYAGTRICYAEAVDTVGRDMRSVSPTVLCSVPRIYEKLHARIMDAVAGYSGPRQRLFHWAIGVGRQWVDETLSGGARPLTRCRRALAGALVFKRLRARTGGRLRFFISGGAPLLRELSEFFHAAGLPILEGYGLTETSPVISVNTFEHMKFGTVGRPLPGVEVTFAEDGEIRVRGDNVMQGYYKLPEETAQSIVDGWFHTGDIGHLDEDGFLVITDRKKDIIVTAGGKNVAPMNVESRLKESPYVSEAVLVGNRRRFVAVIVVPEFDRVEEFARAKGVQWNSREALVEAAAVRELFAEEIERACGKLASFERPKKFILLPREFSIDEGELTPSLKVRRRVVETRLEGPIDSLYTE